MTRAGLSWLGTGIAVGLLVTGHRTGVWMVVIALICAAQITNALMAVRRRYFRRM